MSTIKTNQLAHTANGASVYTLPQTDGSANEVIKTDGSGNLSFGGAGKILQVQYVYHTQSTQLSSSSTMHELSTNLRVSIAPKFASSNLILDFYAPFCCPDSTHLQFAKFYDVTNSATAGEPPASGSRDRVHWIKRTTQYDANDMDTLNMKIVIPATNTTARTYTIYHRTEGVTIQFFKTTLGTGSGAMLPATFTVSEVST